MESNVQAVSSGISPFVGMVFLFNLIVGTGALTLPSAFADCGWIVSCVVITMICFTSYVTATFVIEAISIANALTKVSKRQLVKSETNFDIDAYDGSRQMVTGFLNNEHDPLLEPREPQINESPPSHGAHQDDGSAQSTDQTELFQITHLIECGKLARIFFSRNGVTLFYFCLCLYLYDWSYVTRDTVYIMSVAIVLSACGPFVFFNIQKTKYLQIVTSLYRWVAFTLMIALASISLITGKARGNPRQFNIDGIPSLFGVSLYAFMCHHSLPSLVTPIRNKVSIYRWILTDYVLILSFYLLLSLTGVFTFEKLNDVYTLNFVPSKCTNNNGSEQPSPIINLSFVRVILPLFPIIVLSTNFPIIAITLSNNLRVLLCPHASPNSFAYRFIMPLLAILPPIALSLFFRDLEKLMGVVGSYSGLAIQWLIPTMLVSLQKNAER
ncbi:Transmembrane protein 104, partial [Fragariocoptes setiger]